MLTRSALRHQERLMAYSSCCLQAGVPGSAPVPRRLVECPRDAMQGLREFIPTDQKVRYMNELLKCGFYALDFGSFVSPRAVPQMKDTREVLARLDWKNTPTKLSAVVCNVKGCQTALEYPQIQFLGFPLSLSERFQQQNTSKGIDQAFLDVKEMLQCIAEANAAHAHAHPRVDPTTPGHTPRELIVYLSMAYGNPYQEVHSEERVAAFVRSLDKMGVTRISLSDTVGVAEPEMIMRYHDLLAAQFPHIQFGSHLHCETLQSQSHADAVARSKADWIDCALGGMGGCPFAKSKLVGNIATESVLESLEKSGIPHTIDKAQLLTCQEIKQELFGVYVREILLARVLRDEKHFTQLCTWHFNSFDEQHRGLLTFDQFKHSMLRVFHELGVDSLSDERVHRAFDKVDLDSNGTITLDTYMLGARRLMMKKLAEMSGTAKQGATAAAAHA